MTFITFFTLLLFTIASGFPLSGFRLVPMQWVGPIVPGGPNVTYNGTVEEITAQIKETNPSFDWSLFRQPDGDHTGVMDNKAGIDCWVGGSGNVKLHYLNQQIDYLNGLSGACVVGGGSGTCSRISCSWNTAIWMCNQNDSEMQRACHDLAGYAEDIRSACIAGVGSDISRYIRGTEKDDSGFSIVVGADSC